MATLKIYNGSSWDQAQAKVWDGSAWVGMMKFWDGSQWVNLGLTFTVSSALIMHSVSNGSTATAGVRVGSDGNVYKIEGGSVTQINSSTDWRRPAGSGSGYYVRFSKGAFDPDVDGGTLDTWQELNVNRQVTYQESTDDTEKSGTITVEIATDSGGSNIVASGDASLTATVGTPI